MSDRSTRSVESTSPKSNITIPSPSRTPTHSDTNPDMTQKKSPLSFHLFDSILQRSVTKPLTINTTQEPTIPSRKLAASSSTGNNVPLPEQARCLHSYNAIKEDEICVQKGELVQIVAANQDNRWFVHRDANRTSPAAEGWIPGFVLGLKHPSSAPNPNLSPSPPPPPPPPPSTSLSTSSLHRLTNTSSSHHPTISYESTLPPKPQTTNTCDKV